MAFAGTSSCLCKKIVGFLQLRLYFLTKSWIVARIRVDASVIRDQTLPAAVILTCNPLWRFDPGVYGDMYVYIYIYMGVDVSGLGCKVHDAPDLDPPNQHGTPCSMHFKGQYRPFPRPGRKHFLLGAVQLADTARMWSLRVLASTKMSDSGLDPCEGECEG